MRAASSASASAPMRPNVKDGAFMARAPLPATVRARQGTRAASDARRATSCTGRPVLYRADPRGRRSGRRSGPERRVRAVVVGSAPRRLPSATSTAVRSVRRAHPVLARRLQTGSRASGSSGSSRPRPSALAQLGGRFEQSELVDPSRKRLSPRNTLISVSPAASCAISSSSSRRWGKRPRRRTASKRAARRSSACRRATASSRVAPLSRRARSHSREASLIGDVPAAGSVDTGL